MSGRQKRREINPSDKGVSDDISWKDALRYAYRLLSYRGRSRKELAERLAGKGFESEGIERAIERLEACGLIDDRARAETLKRTAAEAKNLGKSGAMQYLRRMGIERPVAEDALGGYDELDAARRFLRRKMRTIKGELDFAAKKKIGDSLRRRGFSTDTIRKAFTIDEM